VLPRKLVVDDTPTVRLRSDSGEYASLLRVKKVFQTTKGDIAVVSEGAMGVTVYRDGRRERVLGGRGGGPGEFRTVQWVDRENDTVFLFDFELMRITAVDVVTGRHQILRLAEDGGSQRMVPIARLNQQDEYVGVGVTPTRLSGGTRVTHDSTYLEVFRGGHVLARLGPFQSAMRVTLGAEITKQRQVVSLHPLGARLHAVAWKGNVVAIDGGNGRMHVFRRNGARVRERTLPVRAMPMSDEILESAREEALAALPPGGPPERRDLLLRITNALYTHALAPRELPRVAQVLMQADGKHLWVSDRQSLVRRAATFYAVTEEGEVVAELRVPHNLEVHDIGADFVLGIERDADGVESVTRYRIRQQVGTPR
jgi:hypothetical protein